MKTMHRLFDKKAVRITLAVLTTAASMLFVIIFFRFLFLQGSLLRTSDASKYLGKITLQSIVANLPIIIILAALLLCIKQPGKAFFLNLKGKWATRVFLIMVVLYTGSLVRQLILYDDVVTVVFRWLYYLVFIAFFEEFEFRALVPWILDGYVSKYTQWLLPNVLFAVAHCTMPIVTGQSTAVILQSLASGLLGFTLVGMAWEWCKRKTGTLWVGVLIHALMDFGI